VPKSFAVHVCWPLLHGRATGLQLAPVIGSVGDCGGGLGLDQSRAVEKHSRLFLVAENLDHALIVAFDLVVILFPLTAA